MWQWWATEMVWIVDRSSSMWVECVRAALTIRRCRVAMAPDHLRRYHRLIRWAVANNHSDLDAQYQRPNPQTPWKWTQFSPNWCHSWTDPLPQRSIDTVRCEPLQVHRTVPVTGDAIYSYTLSDAFAPILRTSVIYQRRRCCFWNGKVNIVVIKIKIDGIVCSANWYVTVFSAGNTSCTSNDAGVSKKYRSRCNTFRFKIPARFNRARTYWQHKHLAYIAKKEEKNKQTNQVTWKTITFYDVVYCSKETKKKLNGLWKWATTEFFAVSLCCMRSMDPTILCKCNSLICWTSKCKQGKKNHL